MGLIKSAINAVSGTLADSWKDAISCEKMDNNILVRQGGRKADNRSSNKKGNPNVISNGSVIFVEENTCMLTLDGGKITNVVAEPGEYIFDSETSPSIFAGDITASVMDALTRFTFGGAAAREQKVVYINLQPIPGIPFGTGTPMPYPDPRYNTTVELRFYGTFEIRIENAEMAVRFYKEVAGKGINADDLTANDLFKSQQYKNEFMQAMMQALNALSTRGISYNQVASYLSDLTENVQDAVKNNWAERGLKVLNVGLGPVTLSDESKELLKDRLKADTMLGGDVQKAMMTGSVARGIEAAAGNSAGSMIGFMGMNAAMNAGGNVLGQAGQGAQTWTCTCGKINTGKFCENCGKNPNGQNTNTDSASWKCAKCGAQNMSKFCGQCGEAKPVVKQYKCNKCSFTPNITEQPPKFCPECGDPFNDEDLC